MSSRRTPWAVGVALAGALTVSGCSGAVDGPVLTSRPQLLDTGGMAAQVEGVVTMDGDCLVLVPRDSPEASGSPVVWPAGTRWQAEPPAVVLDDGSVVLVGEAVVGGGGYLRPADLAAGSGRAVAHAAAACVGETGEVALFNPGSRVDPALPRP